MSFNDIWSDEERSFYQSDEWRAVRQARLKLDGYRCTYISNGIRCSKTTNLEVHHRISRRKGGKDKDAIYRLTTLCDDHHISCHPHLQFRKQQKPAYVRTVYRPTVFPKKYR